MAKINKTDIILNWKDLDEEIYIDNFKEGMHYFTKSFQLIPNIEKELIEINYDILNEEMIDKANNKKGFVYIMVIEDKIFKIGQTTVTLKDRIGSYNCGKKKNREKGTASVTNYFILQSLLKINKVVDIYTYYLPTFNLDLFGETITNISASPSKIAEGIIIKRFEKKFNRKPIGCGQK